MQDGRKILQSERKRKNIEKLKAWLEDKNNEHKTIKECVKETGLSEQTIRNHRKEIQKGK